MFGDFLRSAANKPAISQQKIDRERLGAHVGPRRDHGQHRKNLSRNENPLAAKRPEQPVERKGVNRLDGFYPRPETTDQQEQINQRTSREQQWL